MESAEGLSMQSDYVVQLPGLDIFRSMEKQEKCKTETFFSVSMHPN